MFQTYGVNICDKNEIFSGVFQPEWILNKIHILPLKNIKAALFMFTENEVVEKGKLAKVLDEYYTTKRIPFFCCSWTSLYLSSLLLAGFDEHGSNKVIEHIGISSSILTFDKEDVGYLNVCREDGEYCITSKNFISYKNLSNFSPVRDTNIILCRVSNLPDTESQNDIEEKIKNILDAREPRKYIYIKKNENDYLNQAWVKKAEKLLSTKSSNVEVAVTGFNDYVIAVPGQQIEGVFALEIFSNCLICVNLIQRPPFKATVICYEPFRYLTLCKSRPEVSHLWFTKDERYSGVETGTSITLSVDKYFVPHVEYKVSNKEIKNGIIITFSDKTFTVEMIKNGNLKKTGKITKVFRQNCDLIDIPIMIGFYDGRIQIGTEAVEIKKEHNSFVVSDILKFMKADSLNLKIDPKWGFQVTNDSDKNILLEFDTFRGRRKTTPSFLMSLMIKWAIKNIEIKEGITDFTPIIISYKLIDGVSKCEFFKACKTANVPENDIQIQRYKIASI
uniref:Uncharacterized protein n=1 Tax=Panagrolaimus davidi TaxID=227884 RepID=A0A914Q6A9_9BILA